MVNGKLLIVLFFTFLLGCQSNSDLTNSNINPQKYDERTAKLFKTKEKIVTFFQPMQVQEGDWLESFREEGQTFEQYLNANPTLPTPSRQTIYIQPIGEFTATQKKVLQLTADYMKVFYNLPVKLNEIKPLENLPKDTNRNHPVEKHFQVKSGYFLNDLLPKMLPEDAAAFICFTNCDLYPDENWNYVFGQATLQNRVGVWSMWRFGNPDKSQKDYKLFLERTLKVAMHETGHMFTMLHCTKYECIMSGSNHIIEADRRPLDACPECMEKIAWVMKYELTLKYKKLSNFWKEKGFKELSAEFTEKEKAVLQE